MNIFNLFGKLTLDNSDYNKGIDEAKNKNNELEKSTNKMSLGAVAGWAAIVAAIMKGVSAIKDAIMNTTEYAGTIKDLAQVYGKTYEQIQEVNYLAQESGKSAEWALKRAESSGQEYWEVLGLTNEQYKEMIANAKDMGIILENEVIDRADMLGDSISQLKYQWQALLTGLLAGDEGAEENMRQFFVRVGDMVEEYAPTVVNFGVQLILQILIGAVQQSPQILSDFMYALQDAFLKINWIDLIWNILRAVAEMFVNNVIDAVAGWLRVFGVDVPQVDFTSSSNSISGQSSSNYKLPTSNNNTYNEDNSTYNISINTDLTGELNYDAKTLANEVIKQIQVAKQSSGR